jgi:hypothetical protein
MNSGAKLEAVRVTGTQTLVFALEQIRVSAGSSSMRKDCQGINNAVILDVSGEVDLRSARVRVVVPERSAVARTLELTGLLEVLSVVSTVSDALAR